MWTRSLLASQPFFLTYSKIISCGPQMILQCKCPAIGRSAVGRLKGTCSDRGAEIRLAVTGFIFGCPGLIWLHPNPDRLGGWRLLAQARAVLWPDRHGLYRPCRDD